MPFKFARDLDANDAVIVTKRDQNNEIVSGQTSAATLNILRQWFDSTGWGYYVDDPLNQQMFLEDQRLKFTVDKFYVDEDQKPLSVETFLSSTSEVTGESGDDRTIRVQFQAAAQSQLATKVVIECDIGGTAGVIDRKVIELVSGKNVNQFISESFELFCRETFEANGCSIYLTFDGPVAVTGKSLLIKQNHKNRVDT